MHLSHGLFFFFAWLLAACDSGSGPWSATSGEDTEGETSSRTQDPQFDTEDPPTASENVGTNASDVSTQTQVLPTASENGTTQAASDSGVIDTGQMQSADETASEPETASSSETESRQPICGDGAVDGTEVCEVGDTASCVELDAELLGGRAECGNECQWILSACTFGLCDNGSLEIDEACEIGDTADCATLDTDLYTGGSASCNASCTALDMSGCHNAAPWTFEVGFGGADYDDALGAVQTYDGGFLVAGYTFSFADQIWTPDDPEFLVSNNDVLLVKLDPRGNVVWHRTYGGAYPESARAIVRAHDGGYVLAGEGTVAVGRTIILYGGEEVEVDKIRDLATITKINESGDILWSRSFGELEASQGFSDIIATSDGNYLATGSRVVFKGDTKDEAVVPFPSLSNAQMYNLAVKVDPYGHVIWERAFFGSGSRWGSLDAVVEVDDGYVACGGMVLAGQEGRDAFAVELAADTGEVVWSSRYPGATKNGGDDYATQLTVIRDEQGDVTGLAIIGVEDKNYDYQTLSLAGNVRVIWTDASGNRLGSKSYDLSGRIDPALGYTKLGMDFGVDIVAVEGGDFVVLATVLFDVYFQLWEEADTYLMRIDSAGNVQWSAQYGMAQRYDTPSVLIPTWDGGFMVAGATQSFVLSGASVADDFYMLKTDADGQL